MRNFTTDSLARRTRLDQRQLSAISTACHPEPAKPRVRAGVREGRSAAKEPLHERRAETTETRSPFSIFNFQFSIPLLLTLAIATTSTAQLKRPVTLTTTPGTTAHITSVSAQSLAGLLPLGWSPIASAEVTSSDSLAGAQLLFDLPHTTRTFTAVRYDAMRDEWIVLAPSVTNGLVNIVQEGAYALVYPDSAPHLESPPPPQTGAALASVQPPDAPVTLIAKSFTLDPPTILPTGRTVATLIIDGTTNPFPSGTPIEAFIDEELRLADGTRVSDPPFATDLILYRDLEGNDAVAQFHLAPSVRATEGVLEVGFEHIRIQPYSRQLVRGTMIGAEGGRVPGDGSVTIDIDAGSTYEALRTSVETVTTLPQIAGFDVLGGFTLTLQGSEGAVELTRPATARVPATGTQAGQYILVEVLHDTPHGTIYRLAALMTPSALGPQPSALLTAPIDRAILPIDGIIREGTYLVLAAQQPIAFATGTTLPGARIAANSLGTGDIARNTRIFALPVLATTFTLVPRTTGSGDGAPYTHPTAAAKGDTVNVGDLPIIAQPPKVLSTLPAANATEVPLGTTIQITFDKNIDPATASLTILNSQFSILNSALAGTLTTAGPVMTWTPAPGTHLDPNTRYLVTVGATTRSTTGAPLGTPHTFAFTTITKLTSTEIDATKIRITIPDANGHSKVLGAPGALPANWLALPTRRDRAFATAPQATAATDGSFTAAINERVHLTDTIDLRVLNQSGALAAIIPLTPFVSEDGRTFVARPNEMTTFTTADGVRVTVPAGAFDEVTPVTITQVNLDRFAGVPDFDSELRHAASIEVTFEGIARRRFDVAFPIPPGLNVEGVTWFAGYLGASIRGPRIMAVDLLRVESGHLVTGAPGLPGNAARRITAMAAETGSEVRDHLLGINRSGTYTAVAFDVPGANVVWGVIEGLQAGVDLFWDTMKALYAAHFYLAESRGTIVIPVISNRPFQIVGVDAATGLESFSRVYDPLPDLDPGAGVAIANPNPNRTGPYPLFGTPVRIEAIDVESNDVPYRSVRDFTVTLANGQIIAETTLPAAVRVALLNVTNGSIDRSREGGLRVFGSRGDRVVLLIEAADVDPQTAITLTFNEPLDLGETDDAIDLQLLSYVSLEMRVPAATDWSPVSGLRARADSGGRRVVIEPAGSLHRGAEYRVVVNNELTDRSGLRIGQMRDESGNVFGGLDAPLYLPFRVRAPGDVRASFEIESGAIRDQALNGNVLLVSALGGGILAYDIADPVGMSDASKPIGRARDDIAEYWTVASDHHGRIYATAIADLFGVLRTYRLEDFLPVSPGVTREVTQRANALVSWSPGAASAMGLASSLVLGDRPEALPRKLQILLQDDEAAYDSREAFRTAVGASATNHGEFQVLTASFARHESFPYATQRITVENLTLDMRWSADATVAQPAQITGIVARAGDAIRVIRNERTYGVISLFGYGIAVYDLNAVESNDAPEKPAGYAAVREQIRLTRGALVPECGITAPPYAIPDLTFTPEAAILSRPYSRDLTVVAVDANRGLLDLTIHPPDETTPSTSADALTCGERAPAGLVFRSRYASGNQTLDHDHPRLAKLRELFHQRRGRDPMHRFTGIAMHRWTLEAKDNRIVSPATTTQPAFGQRGSAPNTRLSRNYLLVPGNEYGLLVVEAGGDIPLITPAHQPLQPDHLVDVIWIPGGAYAVRPVPRTNLAVVVDGLGYVLLVDLSRIDERWNASGLIPYDALFPTVAGVLAIGPSTPDPRIIWKSAQPLASGTLAPIVDGETGFVYVGKLLEKITSVVAALDPRVQVKTDVGAAGGLSEVGGVVPLGIDPPPGVLRCNPQQPGCNASLAAFRLEVSLPGAMTDTLSDGRFFMAVESERVAGAVSEQTSSPLPVAHLRQRTRADVVDPRGDARFAFQRTVPPELSAQLRHQRGFNKFISPWIVAIADPRASERYAWPEGANRGAEGCFSCERPQRLRGLGEEGGVFELFSAGRLFAVRPEQVPLNGTGYAYLGDGDRLATRIATVMADTVRPPAVLVAAQNPPIADGMLQETTYLHSGELETSAVDLVAGGRAGWDVAVDRTYRSRTIGGTYAGEGWDSSLFRRLRELPNGDVEYRDGAGEVWLFKVDRATGAYRRPKGLFLTLARDTRGFLLVGQKQRVTAFDRMGRLAYESDEFATSVYGVDRGNVIRYLYDPTGRLSMIVDPAGRSSTLSYYGDGDGHRTGRLAAVTDWRERVVRYDYDPLGRLTTVVLPQVNDSTPTITYGYEPPGTNLNDALEIAPNLKSITDPIGGAPRVTFTYGSGTRRDRVIEQEWATGESATFNYDGPGPVTHDALGQERRYILSANPADAFSDRAHVTRIEEVAVETASFAFGELPLVLSTTSIPRVEITRTLHLTHEADGLLRTSTLDGVRTTTNTWRSLEPSAPGSVLELIETSAPVTSASRIATSSIGGSVTRRFTYDGAFLRSAVSERDGVALAPVQFPVTHGRQLVDSVTNDSIAQVVVIDVAGRPAKLSGSGGTDTTSLGSEVTIGYELDHAPPHARGLVNSVDRAGLVSKIEYPSPNTVVTTDERGIAATTELDEWLRPKRISTATGGLDLDESVEYDANGRLIAATRLRDGTTNRQTWEYDALGRVELVKSDGIAVGDATQSIETTVVYELPSRRIVRTLPGGAVVTEILDRLGRVRSRTTTTGIGDLREELVYDLAGNLVYSADNHLASATAFDIHGNAVVRLAPDGTRVRTEYDASGQPTLIQQRDAEDAVVSESRPRFTSSGRLESIETKVDETRTRATEQRWDGAGRPTLTASAGRAAHSRFDLSGRLTVSLAGEGTAAGVADALTSVDVTGYRGRLVGAASVTEKQGPAITTSVDYDTFANPTRQQVGTLVWQQRFDQDGNLTEHEPPARPAITFDHDARGNVTAETKPGGATIRHQYAASGAAERYRDPVDEVTSTTTDQIGRPRLRTYSDGTTELFEYDGSRLLSMKDREGRSFTYVYNAKGQLAQILALGGELLERFDYDLAGRVEMHATRDARIRYENFDMEGRPRRTRQIRYADGAGFAGTVPLDEYVQEHTWNLHGERSEWTMPVAPGEILPGGWTSRVEEARDAAGNVSSLRRTLAGSPTFVPLMTADYRNAGRPMFRAIATSGGADIVRTYGYAPATGQLDEMQVTARGLLVAGSKIDFDGIQIAKAALHGVSGGVRANEYTYDERSRLETSRAARSSSSSYRAIEHLDPADFREVLERTDTEAGTLPSLAFERETGHKIAALTRGGETRTFSYGGGAERVDDGRFVYQFDARGRLIKATEKPHPESPLSLRRIHYFYSASDRVVGRRAEYAVLGSSTSIPAEEDWKLEDRAEILAADGLPGAVTFVWDPISDTLVSVFGADGMPLRQIIQGGNGYDDPIEVAVGENGAVHRLYPVFDEAGAGTLQVILNQAGEVVSRTVQEGAYGEDEVGLAGAAVDRIAVTPSRNSGGELTSVAVKIRISESIDPATVVAGARLETIAAGGTVVRSWPAAPTLFDNFTLGWTLTASEWSELTATGPDAPTGDPATTPRELAISVTATLRAAAWSQENGILPPPDWALATRPIHTSRHPFEYREPLAILATSLQTTDEALLFEAPALSSLAGQTTPVARFIVASGFQALPFAEPATGLVYARARWYDPGTGSFLTPDPMGYLDSSNLYSFGAGDPVNNSDPTGKCLGLDSIDCTDYAFDAVMQFADPRNNVGNLKRSARFLGFELKGVALAVPRAVKGIYDVATHLPETVEGAKQLASAIADDPGSVLRKAGNAIINADPDKMAELLGETLALAGAGAAAKTPQGAAALRNVTSVAAAGAREAVRPVFGAIGRMPVITARGRKLTSLDKSRRFFLQDTRTHPGVNYSPVGRALKQAFPDLKLQQHHAVIQKAWYRPGSASQWYPTDRFANAGLRRLGDAGWNLIPVPAKLNNMLGRTRVGTAAFATGVYGGSAYATWEALNDDDGQE
ncbi:MAG TPA: Ig-like domain-containing protein [Thermoanaerobaculia bacterium]